MLQTRGIEYLLNEFNKGKIRNLSEYDEGIQWILWTKKGRRTYCDRVLKNCQSNGK